MTLAASRERQGGGLMDAILSNSSNGAIFGRLGKRTRESRLSREDGNTMPMIGRHSHAHKLHSTDARCFVGAEGQTSTHRKANGGACLAGGRSALAQVHKPQSRQSASHERADALRDDGATRTGLADHRARAQSDARGGCDDRDGQAVTIAGLAPAHTSQSIRSLIADALRAAALAPTVFDALDVTGDALRRLSDLARAGRING